MNPRTGKDRDEATIESRAAHASLVEFTYWQRRDPPDGAVAEIGENLGEGVEIAALMLRRALEIYFHGSGLTRYSWKASIGGPAATSTPQACPRPPPEDLRDPFPNCRGNRPSPNRPAIPCEALATAIARKRGARLWPRATFLQARRPRRNSPRRGHLARRFAGHLSLVQ